MIQFLGFEQGDLCCFVRCRWVCSGDPFVVVDLEAFVEVKIHALVLLEA